MNRSEPRAVRPLVRLRLPVARRRCETRRWTRFAVRSGRPTSSWRGTGPLYEADLALQRACRPCGPRPRRGLAIVVLEEQRVEEDGEEPLPGTDAVLETKRCGLRYRRFCRSRRGRGPSRRPASCRSRPRSRTGVRDRHPVLGPIEFDGPPAFERGKARELVVALALQRNGSRPPSSTSCCGPTARSRQHSELDGQFRPCTPGPRRAAQWARLGMGAALHHQHDVRHRRRRPPPRPAASSDPRPAQSDRYRPGRAVRLPVGPSGSTETSSRLQRPPGTAPALTPSTASWSAASTNATKRTSRTPTSKRSTAAAEPRGSSGDKGLSVG